MNVVDDEMIKDIYRKLGPFDHFEHRDIDETDADTQRSLKEDFEERRSGTKYRGQVSENSMKPDGYGIKIYSNGSIYEGAFDEGQINGYGRAITSNGEVYQGPFVNDQICGVGLF